MPGTCAKPTSRSPASSTAHDAAAHAVRGRVVRGVLDRLQRQDLASNATITRFVANSANVARRIARLYGRDADVIHPPVDTDRFSPGARVADHYVTVSRLVPYKRVDVLV